MPITQPVPTQARLNRTMLAAVSALNAAATVDLALVRIGGTGGTYHHIKWGTSVASGAVDIEVSSNPADADSWASVGSVAYVSGAPISDAYFVPGRPAAIRHRISTIVVGGTVSSTMTGDLQ